MTAFWQREAEVALRAAEKLFRLPDLMNAGFSAAASPALRDPSELMDRLFAGALRQEQASDATAAAPEPEPQAGGWPGFRGIGNPAAFAPTANRPHVVSPAASAAGSSQVFDHPSRDAPTAPRIAGLRAVPRPATIAGEGSSSKAVTPSGASTASRSGTRLVSSLADVRNLFRSAVAESDSTAATAATSEADAPRQNVTAKAGAAPERLQPATREEEDARTDRSAAIPVGSHAAANRAAASPAPAFAAHNDTSITHGFRANAGSTPESPKGSQPREAAKEHRDDHDDAQPQSRRPVDLPHPASPERSWAASGFADPATAPHSGKALSSTALAAQTSPLAAGLPASPVTLSPAADSSLLDTAREDILLDRLIERWEERQRELAIRNLGFTGGLG